MKRKLHFFDTVCLLALLLLLFSIGVHAGKDKRDNSVISVSVTVKLTKSKFSDSRDRVSIDGKYPCDVVYVDGNTISFVCSGKAREAGFLTSGAKYLSKNQPLELVGKESYFYGRILNIEPIF